MRRGFSQTGKRAIKYEVVAGKTTIENVAMFLRELDVIAQMENTTIQAVDARKVAGRQHVDDAVHQAIRSFADHTNIAMDLGVEILLHLSACRQIRKALNIGVHNGEVEVLFIVVGTMSAVKASIRKLNHLLVADSHVLDYREEKRASLMQAFNITEKEITAVGGEHRIPELVRERLAIFDAFK